MIITFQIVYFCCFSLLDFLELFQKRLTPGHTEPRTSSKQISAYHEQTIVK